MSTNTESSIVMKKTLSLVEAPLTRKPTGTDRRRVARQAAWDAAIKTMGMRTVCQIAIDWAEHCKEVGRPLQSELPSEVHRMARPRTRLKPLPVVEECFWAVMHAWIIYTPRTPHYPAMHRLYGNHFTGSWSDNDGGYQVGYRNRSWDDLDCGGWTANGTGNKHNRALNAAGVTIELFAFERVGRRTLPKTYGYYYPVASLEAIEKLDRDFEMLRAKRASTHQRESLEDASVAA